MSEPSGIAATLPVAEALSYWATAAGIVVAVVAGVAALAKYYLDRRYGEWQTASALYGAYLDSALAHPQFYGRCWSTDLMKDPAARNQYTYFVGKFLWTCEQIIAGRSYDEEWRDCLKIIMREHINYLSSPSFQNEKDGYDRRVVAMVEEVVADISPRASDNDHA